MEMSAIWYKQKIHNAWTSCIKFKIWSQNHTQHALSLSCWCCIVLLILMGGNTDHNVTFGDHSRCLCQGPGYVSKLISIAFAPWYLLPHSYFGAYGQNVEVILVWSLSLPFSHDFDTHRNGVRQHICKTLFRNHTVVQSQFTLEPTQQFDYAPVSTPQE
jgi:hypothetical protein